MPNIYENPERYHTQFTIQTLASGEAFFKKSEDILSNLRKSLLSFLIDLLDLSRFANGIIRIEFCVQARYILRAAAFRPYTPKCRCDVEFLYMRLHDAAW